MAVAALCALATGSATALPWPYSEAGIANRSAAREDAQHLLARLRLPPGASLVSTEPAGTPPILDDEPGRKLATLVDATNWWTVPGEPKEVVAWMVANPPTGAVGLGSGTAVTFETEETAKLAEFSWPAVPNVLQSRTLHAAAAPGPSGSSILRADALVRWLLIRPPQERIPASARFVEVVEHRHPKSTVLAISKAPVVRRLAALVDSLPPSQPAGRACPKRRAVHRLRLTFRARPDAPVLAEASQELPGRSSCQPLNLKIQGKRQLPLREGQTVFDALRPMLAAQR